MQELKFKITSLFLSLAFLVSCCTYARRIFVIYDSHLKMVREFPWSVLHHKYKSRPFVDKLMHFFDPVFFSFSTTLKARTFTVCVQSRARSAKKHVCKSADFNSQWIKREMHANRALHLNKQLICANKLVCMQMVIVIYRSCVWAPLKRSRMPFCA